MKNPAFVTALCLALMNGCASGPSGVEKGPKGTIAYLVDVEASEPGIKIEANGDYIGKTPCVIKIFGDRDGTFHNFGSRDYLIKAYPSKPGQNLQTKVFRTGGWWSAEDQIPKKIFFDMSATERISE